ncbi:DinB family protein [Paenibacillus oleatilyticus]|uniref:DinB family protein n=1 Tax=Paenibacillus oleatilyticus TaxID=2594886 RepID=UPI001C1F6443|nr:DinB family protein [Paenibacillus oleatilyticus]MBU7316546.1 DinB family protein [Paenibacillus oleatilyticus]
MNKKELLLHEWDICYDKEDWFPPLREALKGLTAAEADWRPEGAAANTIRETVRHLTFYKERLLKRLSGEDPHYPDGLTNDDTFAAYGERESTWEEEAARLEHVHKAVRAALAELSEDDLERPLPKTTIALSITSLVVHDAYHIGQIVQIRKLQGSWPAQRSFD